MAFKLKDLMVDLLPGAGAAAGPNPPGQCPSPSVVHCAVPSVTQHCPVPSIVHCGVSVVLACAAPSVVQPLCPFPSVGTQCPSPSVHPAAMACPSPSVANPNAMAQVACPFPSLTNTGGAQPNAAQLADLATLKQQLQQQLAQVEQHEQAVHAAAKPQTLQEAEDLHQKMQEAMTELQAHIDDMKKQQQS
jgi:hypothetical protein